MHFKNLRLLLLVFLSSTIFIRCSYFFEEKKKDKQVSYNEKTGTCVSQVNRTIGFYFDATNREKISREEINQISDCYQTSINAILKYTKSGRSDSNQYKAENLELLFNKMHPDVNISLMQLQSYIKLKHFLIGGKEHSLSKEELKTLHNILPIATDLLNEMEPYRGILFKTSELPRSNESYEQYNAIFKLLKFKVGLLLKGFEPYRGSRKIDIKDFGSFIISEFSDGEVESRLKYLDLLVSFKNLVLNEESNYLEINDFSTFIIQTVHTYQALWQFEYFVRDDSIFTSLGTIASFITKVPGQLSSASVFKTITLDSLLDVVLLIEKVMVQSARGSEDESISFSKINDLFLKLEEVGMINSENLTVKTLTSFLENFSRRWLDPGSKNNPDISTQKLAYVRELVLKWFDRQKLVNELFYESNEAINFHKLPKKFEGNKIISEWKTLLGGVSVLHWDDKNRVHFDKRLSGFTYRELTVSNSIRTIVELLMKPFNINKINPLTHKVTEDQAQEVYEAIRDLGVEMSFMDARIFDSGRRGFVEANNFTSRKQNDSFMDVYEGYEYLAIAISSGRLAQNLYESIDPKYYLDYQDSNRELVTETKAFRENLSNRFLSFFNHHKVISRYWEKATEAKRGAFLEKLEFASRAGVLSEKPYDLGEIRTISTILSYLESIFSVFDVDRNGLATKQELRVAERHFRKLMVQFILDTQKQTLEEKRAYLGNKMNIDNPTNEQLAQWLAPKIFIYLLKYGDIPKGTYDFFWLAMSENSEEKQFEQVQADAQSVLAVFSVLGKINHETHIKKITEFLKKQHGFYKEGTLLQELKNQEVAPNCITNESSSFCQWSRLIYCSASMDNYLFEWMSKNRNLFPEKVWQMNSKIDLKKESNFLGDSSKTAAEELRIKKELEEEVNAAVYSTMKMLESTFRTHELFSTLCSYPQMDK